MLHVRNLSLEKKKQNRVSPILKDIFLEIPRGKITLLLGKSGSGKTSVLRCIAQLEKQYTGEIFYERKQMRLFSLKERCQTIGFVPQSYALFPFMTVLDNCAHPLRIVLGMKKKLAYEKALTIIESLEISHLTHSFPHELSGGQQQRVAIVRALTLNPTFLLLDEPTSALDPENTELLLKILLQLTKDGKGIIISSQDMHFAARILNRVFFLEGGQIVESHDSEVQEVIKESRLNRFVFSNPLPSQRNP